MFSKPTPKKVVIRDPKGKVIKQFQMPTNCNLIELAIWTREFPMVTDKWARPCTLTIEDFRGNTQFSRKLRVTWKYLKRDVRELLRSYDPEYQADNAWAHENGFWAA